MENRPLYKKYLKGRHWEQHPTVYAERFADFLKAWGFKGRLVDIGCGTGRDVKVFKEQGFDVQGVDYSESEISQAQQKYADCSFDIQNVEELNFEDESVDGYFMINVIHYVDQERAFGEIHRTLKNDGYMFIQFNLKIIDKEGNTDYSQLESEIEELFEGFDVVERNVTERVDKTPVEHTHTILEVILQKKPIEQH